MCEGRLGKTVEMLALVLLHPAPEPSLWVPDKYRSPAATPDGDYAPGQGVALLTSGATLIVSPAGMSHFPPMQPLLRGQHVCHTAISSQWVDEMSKHCPSLRVFRFHGSSPAQTLKGNERHDDLTAEQLARYDVVVTTFDVLRKEIHFVRSENTRSRRFKRKYERKHSALTQIVWWRVVLDEAQMVDNPLQNAAEVATRLPRKHAWYVILSPA